MLSLLGRLYRIQAIISMGFSNLTLHACGITPTAGTISRDSFLVSSDLVSSSSLIKLLLSLQVFSFAATPTTGTVNAGCLMSWPTMSSSEQMSVESRASLEQRIGNQVLTCRLLVLLTSLTKIEWYRDDASIHGVSKSEDFLLTTLGEVISLDAFRGTPPPLQVSLYSTVA